MDGPRPPDIEEILAELHEDARGRLKEELLPGERLLWAARRHREPIHPSGYLSGALFLLACLVASVASFWFGTRPEWSGDDEAGALAAAGIVAGLGAFITALVMGSGLKSALDKRRMSPQHLFALTDRRLIMRSPTTDLRGIEIRTFDLPLLGNIHRVEYPDGLGAVAFRVASGSRLRVDPEHGGVEPDGSYTMDRIPEARRVELLLRQAFAEAKTSSASRA
jgi:hypothetical protein